MTDEPLTGAAFQREVGADPAKWAQRFLAAYAAAGVDEIRSDADRLMFVTGWFRDFHDAVTKAHAEGNIP